MTETQVIRLLGYIPHWFPSGTSVAYFLEYGRHHPGEKMKR